MTNDVEEQHAGSENGPLWSVISLISQGSGAVERVFNRLALVALFLMMVTITTNAVSRYLFSNPFSGVYKSTELFFMPIVVFLTASHLQKNEGNVDVNILSKRFGSKTKILVRIVSFTATLAIYAWVAYLAAVQAWEGYLGGQVTTGVIQFPTYLSWAVMSVGFALFCLRLGIQVIASTYNLFAGRSTGTGPGLTVEEESELPFQVITGAEVRAEGTSPESTKGTDGETTEAPTDEGRA